MFNLFGIFIFGKSQFSGYPAHMSVNYDARNVIYISADNIGSLAADTGKRCQLIDIRRNYAVMFFEQLL